MLSEVTHWSCARASVVVAASSLRTFSAHDSQFSKFTLRFDSQAGHSISVELYLPHAGMLAAYEQLSDDHITTHPPHTHCIQLSPLNFRFKVNGKATRAHCGHSVVETSLRCNARQQGHLSELPRLLQIRRSTTNLASHTHATTFRIIPLTNTPAINPNSIVDHSPTRDSCFVVARRLA